MLSIYREESPLATEIKRIVSRLNIAKEERNVKSIMVTSSMLGEGKSTTAAYLAIAYSKYRETKTLLIDLDLRRPTVHGLFEVRKRRGVSDILGLEIPVKTCIKQSKYDNLYIITSGHLSKYTPSELFNSARLRDLFSDLKSYFDMIIIDAPPLIPVSDPLLLGSEIDGALFVVKAGKTQKPVIRRALRLLKDARITTLGVVLNNMQHALPYYYEYQFYGYEYYSKPD